MIKKKRYYIFDWDDNILCMPTKIYVEKKEDNEWKTIPISTHDFKKIQKFINSDGFNYRILEKNIDKAFKDFGNDNFFLRDTLISLKNKSFGPSFFKLKEAILYGHEFAIITARSHSSDIIKTAIGLIFSLTFTEEEKHQSKNNIKPERIGDYLTNQTYHSINSINFKNRFSIKGNYSREKLKSIALLDYVSNITEEDEISIGFSDDDLNNIMEIERLIGENLREKHPNIKFITYDTSDPDKIIKNRLYLNQ